MGLPSSGPISLLDIQNEFKGTDAKILERTGVSKLSPTVWTDNTPFTGRTLTTGTQTFSAQTRLTGTRTINPKTSYGSITYSNTSNDDQRLEYSIPINEYYRGALYVSETVPGDNLKIPTSGQISFSDFYDGIGNDIIVTISSNRENLNAKTEFGSADWLATNRKRLYINSGVTIGGTRENTQNYALKIPPDLNGGLALYNSGNILGYGGLPTANGGNAILMEKLDPVYSNYAISSITNNLINGINGVVNDDPTFSYFWLSPVPLGNNTSATILGSGTFNVGDTIVSNIIQSNTIESKYTATWNGYISDGSLNKTGFYLTVTEVTSGTITKYMSIIDGTSYKKHVITVIYNTSDLATIVPSVQDPTKGILTKNSYNSGLFRAGQLITGNNVLSETIITEVVFLNPDRPGYSVSFYIGKTVMDTYYIDITNWTTNSTSSQFKRIEIGSNISIGGQTLFKITGQISGNTGENGRYETNTYWTNNLNIDSVTYCVVNKSQTVLNTNMTGIVYALNTETFDNISTEDEAVLTKTSMTGLVYKLKNSATALPGGTTSFDSKTRGNAFYSPGSGPAGFTITTAQAAVSQLSVNESFIISGSSNTFFNETWKVSSIPSSITIVVELGNSIIPIPAAATGGSLGVNVSPELSFPVRIFNYGYIYGGGGGGCGCIGQVSINAYSIASVMGDIDRFWTPERPTQINTYTQTYSISISPGSNGTGGYGQGYGQANATAGTAGVADSSARYSLTINYQMYRYNITELTVPPNVDVVLNFTQELAFTQYTPNNCSVNLIRIGENVNSKISITETRIENLQISKMFAKADSAINPTAPHLYGSYLGGVQAYIARCRPAYYKNITFDYRDSNASGNNLLFFTGTGGFAKDYYQEAGPFNTQNPYVIPLPEKTWTLELNGGGKGKVTFGPDLWPTQQIPGPGGRGGNYGSDGGRTAQGPGASGSVYGLSGYYFLDNTNTSKVTWSTTGSVAGRKSY